MSHAGLTAPCTFAYWNGSGGDQHPQAEGGPGIDGEWGEAAAVGAQDVGEEVGVEAVVLAGGGAVAGAQGGDLPAGDHEHGQAGVEQVQEGDQLAQPSRGALDRELLEGGAGLVDRADGVFGPRPVHSGVRTGPSAAMSSLVTVDPGRLIAVFASVVGRLPERGGPHRRD
jgi:hypothetical protein